MTQETVISRRVHERYPEFIPEAVADFEVAAGLAGFTLNGFFRKEIPGINEF